MRDIAGALPRPTVSKVFTVCRANNFEAMQRLISELLADGYPVAQLARQLLEVVLNDTDLSSMQKSKIALKLAEVDIALTDGADEHLQLTDLFAFTMRSLQKA